MVAWLNNCVGHWNHRYFYTYMAWMCIGVIFVIIFGVEILYAEFFSNSLDEDEVELEGHPVHINTSGAIIPVVSIKYQSVMCSVYLRKNTLPKKLTLNHKIF